MNAKNKENMQNLIRKEASTKHLEEVILRMEDFLSMDFPESEAILDPWLTKQSLVQIVGEAGVGKSWFAIGVVVAVSRGASFGPWKTLSPVNALYVDGEMTVGSIRERFDLMRRSYGAEARSEVDIYSSHLAVLKHKSRLNLTDEPFRQELLNKCLERKIELVVLDNLSSLCPGIDENSKKDWDPINQWLIEMRFNGISTMMLHHTNKSGGQRGTSARIDNLDISISLEKPSRYRTEDGARFLVKFVKKRVKESGLPLVANIEFQLKQIGDRVVWIHDDDNKKQDSTLKILRLFADGKSQKAIAGVLQVSETRVSQHRKKFAEMGYLTPKGSVTEAGKAALSSN